MNSFKFISFGNLIFIVLSACIYFAYNNKTNNSLKSQRRIREKMSMELSENRINGDYAQ
jgi:hypothetical protein